MPGEQLPLDLEGLEPYTPPAPPPPPPKQQPWEPPPRPARQPKPEAPVAKPFSYTQALGEVVRDVIATLPELAHVDQSRILLAISQARQASKHGVYATCMPLRFEGGAKESVYNGRRYAWPVLHHEEREILYLIYFTLPRFHEEQDYPEKLATIIHELYHISPQFNGDLRRFPGKNFAHGSSRESYHAAMRQLAKRYLATSPRAESFEFLKEPFGGLLKRPSGVVGFSIARPRPELVPPVGKSSK